MVELNRRTFLSGSVAAGAVALFGTEAAHAAGAVKLPAKWDETADVVIVGSGFAGLAAAIEGYLINALSVCSRVGCGIAALLLINTATITDIIGVCVFAAVLAVQLVNCKKASI